MTIEPQESTPESTKHAQMELARCIRLQASTAKHERRFRDALRLRVELDALLTSIDAPLAERCSNLNMMAFLGLQIGDYATAERAARSCVELYQCVDEKKSESWATYLSMLASVLAETSRFDEAAGYEERALEIFEQNHGSASDFVKIVAAHLERMRSKSPGFYIERID